MTDPDRPGPPPDPTSLSREYLVLTRRARTDGVSADEEARRRALRGLLLALGEKHRPMPPAGLARAFVRAPLQLSLWFGSAAEFARAFAVSLGQGGLMLHTRNPWPAGSSVTLDFRRGVLGRVRASVVWSEAASMGVRFEGLSEEQDDEITEMVAWALAERVLDLAGGGRRQLRPGVGLQRPAAPKPPLAPAAPVEEEVTPRPMALPPRRSLDAAREARARKALGVPESAEKVAEPAPQKAAPEGVATAAEPIAQRVAETAAQQAAEQPTAEPVLTAERPLAPPPDPFTPASPAVPLAPPPPSAASIRRPTPPPLPLASIRRPTPPPLPQARPAPASAPDEEAAPRVPSLRPGVGPVKK